LPNWATNFNPFEKNFSREPSDIYLEPNSFNNTLTRKRANDGLKAATSEILGFYGYSSSDEHTLQCLTDLSEQFLIRICDRFSVLKDSKIIFESHEMHDILARVMSELGLPNFHDLLKFYEEDVVKPFQTLISEISSAHTSPLPSLEQQGSHNSTQGLYFIGGGSNENDIPEIHFPSSDEGDLSLDHAAPHLETGLQMLQSLEQGSLGSQAGAHIGADDDGEGPPSHDSNSALLLATVSPTGPDSKRRRK
jgi:hypothetical protein